MSEFAKQWTAAKKKFETDTGVNKPAEKGKILFISYRKSTHIEGTLEKLDDLLKEARAIESAPPDTIKAAEKLVKDLQSHGNKYMQELTKAIDVEKQGGKDTSTTYRSLKILRATLDKLVSSVEHDLERGKAGVKATQNLYKGKADFVFRTLKTFRTSIKLNCANALVVAQNLLQDPTPDTFNDAFPGVARNITQAVGNLYKYAFPQELTGKTLESVEEHLNAEPRLLLECKTLETAVKNSHQYLQDFVKKTGTDPTDASLWQMADSPPQFPATADADEVKKGIKNFIGQVKVAIGLVNILQQAGV